MTALKKILPQDLQALGDFSGKHPIKVDLVYAQKDHHDNIFKTALYKKDAKMWGHRELVPVILRAADICFKKTGYIFELKDCLRPVEAQEKMRQTDIVKAHPEWLEEPGRLLSPPGKGGHPRGMAVDIILVTENGDEVDMGTRFDFLTKENNPSARDYRGFSAEVLDNRRALEESMVQAALELGREILPLPQEWWDFRFPYAYSNAFEPLSDADLPAHMKVVEL